MLSYSIGLSGLNAAQQALEMIGTNIANASTDGYHKQEVQLAPESLTTYGQASGGGVRVTGAVRDVDTLLESELTRQQATLSQSTEELNSLQSIEGSLGNLDQNGIGAALTQFFSSMQQLSSQPSSQALREQVSQSASSLCSQIQNFSEFLSSLRDQVYTKAQATSSQVNSLSSQVADLNSQILAATSRGGTPNMLEDQRDQAINNLANLLGVQASSMSGQQGVVDVTASGGALVMGAESASIQVGRTPSEGIGIAIGGQTYLQTDWQGGSLGGMLHLANDVIPQISGQLDALAKGIIRAVNQIHVQGVGANGSFTSLTGVTKPSGLLSGWDAGVQNGDINIRITDASGNVTRQTVQVNPKTDTLQSVAAKIDAMNGMSASVVNGALQLQADNGCTFDFLPEPLPNPDTSNITGSVRPTVSGAYNGDTNDVFTCTVKGSGQVGNSDPLDLEVRNQAGELVGTFNVGTGYAAGDQLQLSNGLSIALNSGQLNNGDNFTVQGLATTDTSGFLSAAGINTFFTGNSAVDMAVAPDILADSNNIACASAASGSDNLNIARMSDLVNKSLDLLGKSTAGDYFNQLVTSVGQKVSDAKAQHTSTQGVVQNLQQQRDGISAVDVNSEAASLMIYERMYQGMAKFLTTQDQALQYLMQVT